MKRIALGVVLMFGLATPVWAGPSEGWAAYSLGEDGSVSTAMIDGEMRVLENPAADALGLGWHMPRFVDTATPPSEGEQRLTIEAGDSSGGHATEKLRVWITADSGGDDYALVVGISNYAHLPSLPTAVNDAEAIAEVLRCRYGFDVTLLTDAGRREIMGALGKIRRWLMPEDQLLVYFSGHGLFDADTSKSFWQPVDAVPDDDFTWISIDDVRRYIRNSASDRTLVIADSALAFCRANCLITPEQAEQNLYKSCDLGGGVHLSCVTPSRWPTIRVIWAGGTEPVPHPSGHSQFAYRLLETLTNNEARLLTSSQLFRRSFEPMKAEGSNLPIYGILESEADDPRTGEFTLGSEAPPDGCP